MKFRQLPHAYCYIKTPCTKSRAHMRRPVVDSRKTVANPWTLFHGLAKDCLGMMRGGTANASLLSDAKCNQVRETTCQAHTNDDALKVSERTLQHNLHYSVVTI